MSQREQRFARARARRRREPLFWITGIAMVVVVLVAALVLLRRSPASLTPADLPRLSPQETYDLMQRNEAILYDVRSAEAYRAGHAEGAVSLPETEALQRLAELPSDRLLVFV